MIRRIVIPLILMLLVVGVFLTARHLDANPIGAVPESLQDHPVKEPAEGWDVVPEWLQTTAPTEGTAPEETEPPAAVPDNTILLTFAGDCNPGTYDNISAAKKGIFQVVGEDYAYPFRNIRQWLAEDDFTLVNLEGTLTNEGFPTNGVVSFRAPEDYVRILTESGIEAVSLANDHVRDYGNTGYANTCAVLENAGVSYVEQNGTRIVELENGVRIGLFGTMFYEPDQKFVKQSIASLRDAGADVVIVAAHWGNPGYYQPGEDMVEMAHTLIDAGADIVYGTHPQVLQPMERYGDELILYSMGTICNGGYTSVNDYDTALVQVELTLAEDGVSMGEPVVIPCAVSSAENENNYQPMPYAEDSEGCQRVLSKLEGSWKGNYLKRYG